MSDKTVLITGASSGFGKATAQLLSQHGYKLILIARRLDRLEEIQRELSTPTHIAKVDVTKKNEVKEFFENLPDEFKNIDILINNAGGAIGLDLSQDANLEDWENMIETNNKGLVFCTHFTLEIMRNQNSGHIINIGSIAGTTAYPRGNVYGATKAFVDNSQEIYERIYLGRIFEFRTSNPELQKPNFLLFDSKVTARKQMQFTKICEHCKLRT